VNIPLVTLLAIAAVGLVLCVAAMISAAGGFARADRADAQPDFTPLDEPDPVDAADDTLPDWIRRLRDDMTACEADGWVLDMYRYLDKERSQ
jgi:hypothetical protein